MTNDNSENLKLYQTIIRKQKNNDTWWSEKIKFLTVIRKYEHNVMQLRGPAPFNIFIL